VGQNAETSAVLIALTRGMKGARWELERGEFLIGRGSDCDLTVNDRQVSRHHARIRQGPRGFVIEDLGSKNGTHVNGIRIESPTVLEDGDVVQVALALELAYVGTDATLPLSLSEAEANGLTRLQMDPAAHRVWLGSTEVEPPLSPPQYRLLELLHEHRGGVVTREQIAEHVWPGTYGEGVSEQAIDALVRRLRDRLVQIDPEHEYILTVRGHGFRLAADS
jgi:pSer/pThr/pTyr-binding forkhead associated (FHA) protein